MNVKIFVETDAEVRVSRRLLRDIHYDNFIAPTKSRADIIVPYEDANPVMIYLLVCGIGKLLNEHLKRRCSNVRSRMRLYMKRNLHLQELSCTSDCRKW
ncbi:unnamed protein product [Rodentolepis nana]|uniref:PRK domain-containing protein n=1 Tax=Rodentolepis nana TaxID=102285 RepID=A0A0R3U038_RODNA|nr:unnamed protein product [Rodentolepis nana]